MTSRSTYMLWSRELVTFVRQRYRHRNAATTALSVKDSSSIDRSHPSSPYRSQYRHYHGLSSTNSIQSISIGSTHHPLFPQLPSPYSSSSSSSSSDSIKDHYKILGITHEANQKEIKAAYIAKSKLFHPDNNRGRETEAQEQFIRVAAAYKVLSSRRHRSEYDVELENMLRSIRNEAPLTQEEVDAKLKDREKYGFWNVILPYGSAISGYDRADESNWKFMGRALLYLMICFGGVFWAMKIVEFTYGDIIAKRRRAIKRRERMRREIELEQKREG